MLAGADAEPRFAFPPDPTGWYHLAESRDVMSGTALRVDALGASLDVSRDAAGSPRVAHPRRGAMPAEDANGSLLAFWDARGRAPLLCEADGPIATWRRWCRQFYA